MSKAALEAYQNQVELKYQLYNGLFLTLPLDAVQQAGLLLPLLGDSCRLGLEQGLSPAQIIDRFFDANRPDHQEKERLQFLFKVIQYVERQVVLVDALEEAAYDEIHQTEAQNELRKLLDRVEHDGGQQALLDLLGQFHLRIILTAHPTQFYPGTVLGIINDLRQAIEDEDIAEARALLQQLGNTPFFNKTKPTPESEADRLTWYLSNIFYVAIGDILDRLASAGLDADAVNDRLIGVGFWPGGDRDGNPFVKTETTQYVAARLRELVIRCYYEDIRQLKRRLSFRGVQERLQKLENALNRELSQTGKTSFDNVQQFLDALLEIREIVIRDYQGLWVEQLDSFLRKLRTFGFYFASLDIRQDSRVLDSVLDEVVAARPELFPANWPELGDEERNATLLTLEGDITSADLESDIAKDTIDVIKAVKEIQKQNGERACHRFIISNCRGARNIATLTALFRLSGWRDEQSIDLVPLFETVDDLKAGGDSMEHLYSLPQYRGYLKSRGDRQTVMLGFSDGTKDGGYLMANWGIYRAKEDITRVSRSHGVEVIFFDGRGGPPARGGGNAYKFYAALGKQIESNDIQITIQGQTISSYYGTLPAAFHNLHQLLAAGLENKLYDHPERELSDAQRILLDSLATDAYHHYVELKEHPLFLEYLEQMSPLHFYAQSNIASRPAKRGGGALKFEDLRAIPFVGSWGQLKQNVPAFYGVGTALKKAEEAGRLDEVKALYRESRFFKALIDNSMQGLMKANYRLTAYMERHERFGEFWVQLNREYSLSYDMMLKVTGQTVLLEDNPSGRRSIQLRQQIVLPLLVIQQYALMRLNELDKMLDNDESGEVKELQGLYEKLIIRSLFGNINASRNSA